MDMWSRLKKGSKKSNGASELETWMGDHDSLQQAQKEQNAKEKNVNSPSRSSNFFPGDRRLR